MQAVSDAEKSYIEEGAAAGIRSDGRAHLDIRPVTLETGILPTASGSARVRIGAVTDILVGIKAEVVEPSVDQPEEGMVTFSVECSSLASPDFVGRGGQDLNAELSQMLGRLYKSPATRALRRELCIIKGVKCWVLHVDALVLDSGGNLYGALSIAVCAALRVVLLPRVIVIRGEADEPDEIEVDEEVFEPLSCADGAPVAVTLSAIGGRGCYVADCTSEEEACIKCAVTVGVNQSGKSCGIVSGGSGGVDMHTLGLMLADAVRLGVGILKTMDSFLREDVEKRLKGEVGDIVGFFA